MGIKFLEYLQVAAFQVCGSVARRQVMQGGMGTVYGRCKGGEVRRWKGGRNV